MSGKEWFVEEDKIFYFLIYTLTLFRVGFFRAAHAWGGGGGKKAPHTKTCHTYPTMMKLGTVIPCLKKIQKLYNSRDTAFFHWKSATFAISRNTDTDCIFILNF